MSNDRALQADFDTIEIPFYDRTSSDIGIVTSSISSTTNITGELLLNAMPLIERNASVSPYVQGSMESWIEKRQGLEQTAINIRTTAGGIGGTNEIKCLALISVGQLSDVLVGAFLELTALNIHIYQIRPSVGTLVKIGTIANGGGAPAQTVNSNSVVFLTEASFPLGSTPSVLVSVSAWTGTVYNTSGWYAPTSSGVFVGATLVQLSSAGFPSNLVPAVPITGPFNYMDGYLFIMGRNGSVYNSDICTLVDNHNSWNTAGYLNASMYPDLGVSAVRYKQHIVAFGRDSVEFFDDVANPVASPLAPTQQAFIKFGAMNPKSIINIDDILYWISVSSSGTTGVWKLDGYTPTKISTPELDAVIRLNTYSSGESMLALGCLTINNRKQLMVYLNSNTLGSFQSVIGPPAGRLAGEPTLVPNDCPVFCYVMGLENNLWWHFGTCFALGFTSMQLISCGYHADPLNTNTESANYLFGVFSSTVDSAEDVMMTISNSGNNPTTFLDNWKITTTSGLEVPLIIQTNWFFFGNNKRKFISKLRLNGEDIWAPNATNGYPIYVWTFKGDPGIGVTPSEKKRLLPVFGTAANTQVFPRVEWNNFGMFRKIRFVFGCALNNPIKLKSFEVDISQGTA
ncbi:MAG: hypothetical protein ACYC9R_06430 [Nitrosotalea sp.]